MTEKQLGRIVWTWQKRLGLATWDLKLNFVDPCNSDADATTWRSNTYERAEIRFGDDWKTWTKAFSNVIVVHELVHLLTRDVEESMKPALEGLHAEAAKQIDKQQDREIESLVDRLAYRLVELGGTVG
jgi:hypothetical protein